MAQLFDGLQNEQGVGQKVAERASVEGFCHFAQQSERRHEFAGRKLLFLKAQLSKDEAVQRLVGRKGFEMRPQDGDVFSGGVRGVGWGRRRAGWEGRLETPSREARGCSGGGDLSFMGAGSHAGRGVRGRAWGW